MGSTLRLSAIIAWEAPDAGELTGTITVGADGSKATISATPWPTIFGVVSGPCAVSEGGRCVGRADGYGPQEECVITVGGGGGVLGPCGVFDMDKNGDDYVGLCDHSQSLVCLDSIIVPPDYLPCCTYTRSDCPAGVALAPGDSVRWKSNSNRQGSVAGHGTNGCTAKGLCGLPWTYHGSGGVVADPGYPDFPNGYPNGLGGGWQICFEG